MHLDEEMGIVFILEKGQRGMNRENTRKLPEEEKIEISRLRIKRAGKASKEKKYQQKKSREEERKKER